MKLESLTSKNKTQGSVCAGGTDVSYEACFEVADFAGGAQVTAVSYVAATVGGDAACAGRPVLFVTNGGPGSSVAWLHLGLFGPRRVQMEDPLRPPTQPPFSLEDNPHCPLDVCDVVVVDPAGTGLSAQPDEQSAAEFFSVDGDALSIALFIQAWVDEHGRGNSPVYFAGESYGTVRACALLDALSGGPFSIGAKQVAFSLAGVAFLGTAFTTAATATGEPPVEKCALQLASCAATYAYHHPEAKVAPRKAFEAAWDATPEYLGLLFSGRAADDKAKRSWASRLSGMTGIPKDALMASSLRFSMDQFRGGVVAGSCAGAYDGHYLMEGAGKSGNFPFPGMVDPVAEDPAMGYYSPAFVGGMRLLREELGLPAGEYVPIDFAVNARWDYSSRHTPLNALENAMRRNPSMRVLFASGMFDLVCVPGAVRYLVQQSTLPAERTRVVEYESGHMPYLGEASARQVAADIRDLVQPNR